MGQPVGTAEVHAEVVPVYRLATGQDEQVGEGEGHCTLPTVGITQGIGSGIVGVPNANFQLNCKTE